jgi:hypothetical protein
LHVPPPFELCFIPVWNCVVFHMDGWDPASSVSKKVLLSYVPASGSPLWMAGMLPLYFLNSL